MRGAYQSEGTNRERNARIKKLSTDDTMTISGKQGRTFQYENITRYLLLNSTAAENLP